MLLLLSCMLQIGILLLRCFIWCYKCVESILFKLRQVLEEPICEALLELPLATQLQHILSEERGRQVISVSLHFQMPLMPLIRNLSILWIAE